jgi:iron complex outermembrane recepter protein
MTALRTLLLGCLLGGVFMPPAAGAEPTLLSADIAPRPLPEALTAFGRQTGLQLIYVSSVAETQHSRGAPAGLTAPAALAQLLEGTGLTFEFLNARTVRIFPVPAVVPTLTASSAVPPQHPAARAFGLEEVLVTGTRGQEPLSRVPIDMAAWTAEAVEASHVQGIAQIAALTPGVDFGFSPTAGDEYTDLVIRGVTNRHGAAVGVYMDDSPIPPGRNATYLLTYPATFDLERVEILRGPQTVLLGDHAQSGAVRFITNQPSLTAFTGLLRAELGATEYGSMSYEAGAAVGGPLRTDVLGFRVSGWFRQDGGYVDRVDPFPPYATLDGDSNRRLQKVVRGALTFAPTASLQLTSSLSYQSVYIHDPSVFDTTLSDPANGVFKYPSLLQQPFEERNYLASLKLTARLGSGELSALASYFDQNATLLSNLFSTQPPVTPADQALFGLNQQARFAELRLTSLDPDASLTWVAGISVSNERARHPISGPGGSDVVDIEDTQLAGFGQIALKFTTRLSASTGVWVGHSKHDSVDEFPPVSHSHTSDTGTAPRFELSWRADERNLVYLIIAKGYGSGGFTPEPLPYRPDTLWSYEIGNKHGLFDGRLRLETSVFHIDWNNGGSPESYNVGFFESQPVPGKAVSNGFGVTAQALVGDHAKAALSVAYTDAHLAQTLLTLDGKPFVHKGDSLPVSPWNVTASIERDFQVGVDVTASVRAEDAFRSSVGPTYLDNQDSPLYLPSPKDSSVNVLNLRAAVRWPHFEAAAFLGNTLGSHPIQSGRSGGVVQVGAPLAVTLVPRTLSVSGTWRF